MTKISLAIATALLFSVAVWAQSSDSAAQSTTQSTTKTTTTTTPESSSQSGATPSQSGEARTNSNVAAGQTTVTGCLSGASGTYVLTEDKTGTAYMLMGSDAQLAKQVGHEVSISGSAENPNANNSSPASTSSSSASSSEGTSANPDTRAHHVRVSSVQEIADHCKTNNTNPK